MPLSVDDEIFLEKSFQRTLIELDKLIGYSGTPTVVWRRTGEIMLVGTEFTLLSEWRREELLFGKNEQSSTAGVTMPSNDNVADEAKHGSTADVTNGALPRKSEKNGTLARRRYIFELFSEQSTVEYYESLAAHAFESSSTVSLHSVEQCRTGGMQGRTVVA